MKPVYVEFVNHGVANRFSETDCDVIEVNRKLKEYPELFDLVLLHESQHDSNDYTFKDFKHDMFSRTPGLFRFMFKHPSSFTQLLPFYYDKKKKTIIYDYSTILAWLFIIGLAMLTSNVLRFLL